MSVFQGVPRVTARPDDGLEAMKLAELRALAKSMGIDGPTKKADLITAIRAARE